MNEATLTKQHSGGTNIADLKKKKVCILLGVYISERFIQGPAYLTKQIDSILKQSFQNFTLVIRDDGSSQAILDFLDNIQAAHPEKIHLIKDQLGNLGYTKNYERLINSVDSDYFFTCDQDDIWHKDKVEKCLNAIIQAENSTTKETPLLLIHDADIIDHNDKQINPSFFQLIDHNTSDLKLGEAISSTIIGSFAMCGNRQLAEIATPIFPAASAHDYHLCFTAKALGKVIYLREKLSSYRLHIGGVSNSLEKIKKLSLTTIKIYLKKLLNFRNVIKTAEVDVDKKYHYAEQFLEQHQASELLSPSDRQVINDFIGFRYLSLLQKLKMSYRYGYWRLKKVKTSMKLVAFFYKSKKPLI